MTFSDFFWGGIVGNKHQLSLFVATKHQVQNLQ